MGLPTETDEDIKGIADLGQKIVDMYYSMENRPKGKSVSVSISVSVFVPKPFTPFQFEPQISKAEMERRQVYLKSCIKTRKIDLSTHDSSTSFLEGAFARGDSRLSIVLETAFKKGCKLTVGTSVLTLKNGKKRFLNAVLTLNFIPKDKEVSAKLTLGNTLIMLLQRIFL